MKHPGQKKSYNKAIGDIFHKMAACYRYLGPKERFRAIAYENASRNIQGLKDDLSMFASDKKSLDKISGIGQSMADKIVEYIDTGKILTFEKLKEKVPEGLLELMDITGFGPATVKLLYKKYSIENKQGLITALEAGKLTGTRGFGPKKIENLTFTGWEWCSGRQVPGR